MTRINAKLQFLPHRDLADWCLLVEAEPVDEIGHARRAALIEAIKTADITGAHDIDLLRRVAHLLGTAHTRGDTLASALLRGLATSRRLALAAMAEARIGYLYLQEPAHTDALAADLSLLMGCLDARRAS